MNFSTITINILLARSSAFAPAAVSTSRVPTSLNSHSLRTLAISADRRRSKIPIVIQESKKMKTNNTGAITEKEVRALFGLWNQALATGDSRIVADRYIKNPVLLPTVSDQPRTDFDSVKDYFDTFLLKKPQGKIIEGNVHIGDGWASVRFVRYFVFALLGYCGTNSLDCIKTGHRHLRIHDGHYRRQSEGAIQLQLYPRKWTVENPASPQLCYARRDCSGKDNIRSRSSRFVPTVERCSTHSRC